MKLEKLYRNRCIFYQIWFPKKGEVDLISQLTLFPKKAKKHYARGWKKQIGKVVKNRGFSTIRVLRPAPNKWNLSPFFVCPSAIICLPPCATGVTLDLITTNQFWFSCGVFQPRVVVVSSWRRIFLNLKIHVFEIFSKFFDFLELIFFHF